MAQDKDHRGSPTPTHGSQSQRPTPQSQSQQASKPDPNETEPQAAQPAAAHSDQPPADPNAPPEKPVAKEEAAALLHAGHRLRKKGDPPDKWFSVTRIAGQMCMVTPLDDAAEKEALDQDLVLGD